MTRCDDPAMSGSTPYRSPDDDTPVRRPAGDGRLAAALIMLRTDLSPVVDQLLAGELERDDRAALASALRRVADELSPLPIVIDPEGVTP